MASHGGASPLSRRLVSSQVLHVLTTNQYRCLSSRCPRLPDTGTCAQQPGDAPGLATVTESTNQERDRLDRPPLSSSEVSRHLDLLAERKVVSVIHGGPNKPSRYQLIETVVEESDSSWGWRALDRVFGTTD